MGVDISITMNGRLPGVIPTSSSTHVGTYEVYNNDGTKIGEFVVSSTNAGSSTIVVNSLDLPNYYDPEERPEILYDSDFYVVDNYVTWWGVLSSGEVNCEYVGITSEGRAMFKILDKTNPVVSFSYLNVAPSGSSND